MKRLIMAIDDSQQQYLDSNNFNEYIKRDITKLFNMGISVDTVNKWIKDVKKSDCVEQILKGIDRRYTDEQMNLLLKFKDDNKKLEAINDGFLFECDIEAIDYFVSHYDASLAKEIFKQSFMKKNK